MQLLANPLFWRIIAAIALVIWTAPRIKAWRESIKKSRWDKLLQLAREAVSHTYRTYVQQLKRKRSDGKLKHSEVRQARSKAMTKLRILIKDRAPGLLEYYGQETLEYVIELTVKVLGEKGAKP